MMRIGTTCGHFQLLKALERGIRAEGNATVLNFLSRCVPDGARCGRCGRPAAMQMDAIWICEGCASLEKRAA